MGATVVERALAKRRAQIGKVRALISGINFEADDLCTLIVNAGIAPHYWNAYHLMKQGIHQGDLILDLDLSVRSRTPEDDKRRVSMSK